MQLKYSFTFGVVGAGQMGTGIAIVANAVGGMYTKIVDINEQRLFQSRKFIESWCDKEITKKRMDDLKKLQILQRTSFHLKNEELFDCDLVVEAAPENFDLKSKVLKEIDLHLKKDAILASNTSSISITKLAAETKRPEKFIGLHFMNPVPVMNLVEVSEQVTIHLMHAIAIAKQLKKETVASKDFPGFICNRILMPYINEAVYTLQDGIASVEDIDKAMKLCCNVPMGPLTLADFIGLDTCLSIMQVLHTELGDSKYRPSPLLINYVNAGYLGKKSGRGFYQY
ncbi:hypothetical protein pb186bvf_020728 [Paramecium bursaria]